MREHLDTLSALRAVTEGRLVPPAKYAALVRGGLIVVHGRGARHRVALTDAGRERLSSPPPRKHP